MALEANRERLASEDEKSQTKSNLIGRLVSNIEQVMVGKKETIELLCVSFAAQGHVLIEDVPGTGKTTLAIALAKSIGGSFSRISCTPDVMPSDITGFSMYNPKKEQFEFREGSIMSNVFLADEINRTPPKTQSGLLEAMEEHKVTVDGHVFELPKPFMVMATQNPIEYLGTYPLPEAQLDRFISKITIGYPTEAEELHVLNRFSERNPMDDLTAIATLNEFIEVQKEISRVLVSKEVGQYIVALAHGSRKSAHILLGISPRGSLSLAHMAKAWAYYQGRNYVTPDDVKKVFIPVCAHRILSKPESKYENMTHEKILKELLQSVPVAETIR